jgi:hypothetical protein
MKTFALTPKQIACLARLLDHAIGEVEGDLSGADTVQISDTTVELLNDQLSLLIACRSAIGADFDDADEED